MKKRSRKCRKGEKTLDKSRKGVSEVKKKKKKSRKKQGYLVGQATISQFAYSDTML